MALFTATVRVTVEGYIDVEADDEEAAAKIMEGLDYVQVMNDIDVETEEVEILGELEESLPENEVYQ